MKAMVQTGYGSPDVLELQEAEKPSPKDNEVLIRLEAACVGPSDCAFRKGDPFIIKLMYGWQKPKYPIGGAELAGVVEEIGSGVKQFKPGDRVLALSAKTFGAHAQFKCLPEDSPMVTIPDGISYEEAVGVCDGGATALTFLRDKAKVKAGQKVLVNGASGAVGIYAVQLAKYYGAEVTAVCSAANAELVVAMGADRVIDYTREDFAVAGDTYDVIFDAVGKRTFTPCKGALKPRGIYMTTVPQLSAVARMLWTSRFNGKKVIFAAAGLMQNKANFRFLMERVTEGRLQPVIDRRYPLERLAEAHAYVETERKKGNVIITF
ncbi:NAD(P)-dependent alcohol dehydrogenase [Cohnella panacarvi]|uniref:NAD(P)-dependent alcohol dehydrogenase n=1 Tax=Cohnella panacarvi TaxID=400776 RepID=UPI00047AF784|nr:NAD(P)-dependent alcohol dehydrogenase [Cohnella panacarvi]